MANIVPPVPSQIPLVDDEGRPSPFGLQFLNSLSSAINGKSSGQITIALLGGMTVITGSGSPIGVVAAAPGALYLSTSGGSGKTLWVKETGTDASGWASK